MAVVQGEELLCSVLRGSPSRRTELMEALQESYVRGVAAAAGCVISGRPEIDEGVDIFLSHRSDQHADDGVARLEVQLKATATSLSDGGASVRARLSRSRYDYFRTVNPSIKKIVVIMHVPDDQSKWVELGEDALLVRHRAFWVNLDGLPSSSSDSITVTAPTANCFDDVALCRMMERIGQGGKP